MMLYRAITLKGSPLHDPRGFTLVEAILSIVVLGVALVPLMNLFYQGAERTNLVPQVVAPLLAAEKMEEAVAARALSGWTSFTVSPTNYANVDSTKFPGYQWRVQVDNVQKGNFNQVVGSYTGYKKITVFLKRPGDADDTQAYKLTTIVTDY